MKDLNENNDNNKGFFVALTSIATVCIIIFLGTIIFFPNKIWPQILQRRILF